MMGLASKFRGWRARSLGLSTAGSLALLACLTASAQAADKRASLVIDANTGNVISSVNADEPRYPASLTKMMTLYVVFELTNSLASSA